MPANNFLCCFLLCFSWSLSYATPAIQGRRSCFLQISLASWVTFQGLSLPLLFSRPAFGQSLSPLCFSINDFLPVFQEQVMGLSVSLLFLNIFGLHGFQTFRPHLNYFRLNPCEGIFFKFIWHDFQNSRCGAPPHLFPPILQLPIVFGVQLTKSHIFSLTETEYDPPNKWCALYALNQHKPWN